MATEYISREAAWNGIYNCPTKTDADGYIWVRTKDVAHMIDEIPAADVRPVVRGKWKHDGSDWKNRFICDQCGYKWFFEAEEAHFCPNCGADMREKKEGAG